MRLPYQTLTIPYRHRDGVLEFCVLHRSDDDRIWQFISGGGEEGETPPQTAAREVWEEAAIRTEEIFPLLSKAYVPTCFFSRLAEFGWPRDTYVIPEHTFAFPCREEIVISEEHTEYEWMSFEEAWARLYYDSNRTALYELKCRLAASHS